jgi:hypothetical protein
MGHLEGPASLSLGSDCDPILNLDGVDGRTARVVFADSYASVRLQITGGGRWEGLKVSHEALRAVMRWLLGGPWWELHQAGIMDWPERKKS